MVSIDTASAPGYLFFFFFETLHTIFKSIKFNFKVSSTQMHIRQIKAYLKNRDNPY